ncbi:MAG: METTL5 family protein [Candidatus Bathyarchaeia archaeon]
MTTRPIQIRKHNLAIAIQKVNPHPKPIVALEQYTIPADLAAEILFTACYAHDDIREKCVLDLGTGTGRLALGASILGAKTVVGIDIDAASIRAASQSAKVLREEVSWIVGDIGNIRGSFDTVVMNPPFGTKQPHADLQFLQCAQNLASVIYSIHKSSTRNFLGKWLQNQGLKGERIMSTEMEIPHQFSFHRKPKRFVEVDVFRILRT